MQKWRISLIVMEIFLLASCKSRISSDSVQDKQTDALDVRYQRVSVSSDSVCEEQTARLVARAYVLSMPLYNMENEMIPLMAKNKSYFIANGKAIKCMQLLGNALIHKGVKEFEQVKSHSATERFGGSMPEGLEDLPRQVDASMQSYSNDIFTIGTELLWLSKVLPPAADGDYKPYNTTSTQNRQMIIQVLQVLQMLCQMDPGSCQGIETIMQQTQPMMEQQIYVLAKQVCN